jgi:hypothetical protein
MKKELFRPTALQVQWLLVVGFVTIGFAIYVRYLAIEYSQVAIACDQGLQSALCKTRFVLTSLFRHSVFGYAGLVIAALHVLRPSMATLTAGMIVAGLGVVLYNVGLSGVAIALLILGFARPAPATA